MPSLRHLLILVTFGKRERYDIGADLNNARVKSTRGRLAANPLNETMACVLKVELDNIAWECSDLTREEAPIASFDSMGCSLGLNEGRSKKKQA